LSLPIEIRRDQDTLLLIAETLTEATDDLIQRRRTEIVVSCKRRKRSEMTYLDVVYRYGLTPGEREMRAIDGMREVYGVRRVDFNEKDKTVRVEFDASRLKDDGVARLLRLAGIDVKEKLALA
jgi:hypothetical protein